MSRLLPTLTLSVGVIAFMFMFTYLPQAAIMTIFNGPLAAFSAALLTLSESSTIITLLSKNFLIEEALLDTFDGVCSLGVGACSTMLADRTGHQTLVSRNMTDTVSEGRQIKPGADPMAKLGKIAKKPFEKFTPKAIIRYFIYLPLNFIPLVGTAIFLTLQGMTLLCLVGRWALTSDTGKRVGESAHNRYFQLKKWSNSTKEAWIREHQAAYTRYL